MNMKNNILVRLLLSACCIGALLFCSLGFMATFEPLDPTIQVTWRVIYSIGAALSLGGVWFLNRRGKDQGIKD